MKRYRLAIVIACSVLIISAFLANVFMKAEIPDSFVLSGPVKVHYRGAEKTLMPGDAAYSLFEKWITNNKKGWRKHLSSYFITYAYEGYFAGENFSMEYSYDKSVIFWFNHNPIGKKINKDDFNFYYELFGK